MPTSVWIDLSVKRRSDPLAAPTGRTKGHFLRRLVATGMHNVERQYPAAARRERKGVREARHREAEAPSIAPAHGAMKPFAPRRYSKSLAPIGEC